MRAAVGVVFTLLLASTAVPALAAKRGEEVDKIPAGARITLWASTAGEGDGGSRVEVPCRVAESWTPVDDGPRQPLPVDDPGRWHRIVCQGPGVNTSRWHREGDRPPADFIDAIFDEATKSLFVKTPSAQMSPVPDFQTVQWPTWLWIDPGEMADEVVEVGLDVNGSPWAAARGQATAERLRWDMGNGDWVRCTDAGTAAPGQRGLSDPTPPCGYTYRHTSAEEPDLRFLVVPYLDWEIRVRCTLGCTRSWGPIDITTRGEPVGVRVGEIQALVVG